MCAEIQSHCGQVVRVCGSDDHSVPAHPKKSSHLLYLLPAACTGLVFCL